MHITYLRYELIKFSVQNKFKEFDKSVYLIIVRMKLNNNFKVGIKKGTYKEKRKGGSENTNKDI